MSVYGVNTGVPQWVTGSNCNRNCSTDTCPDFIIKRHDTKPPFRVSIEDCLGAPSGDLDSNALVAEVSMWSTARLKTAITADATSFALADNTGFNQMLVGDVLVMDRVRQPEQMLVVGFDEANKLVQVQRGYNDTTATAWVRGTAFKIFRIRDATATIERTYEDIINTDGTTSKDQLVGTYLVYEWQSNDTCVPGCFVLEFKLLQLVLPPSNISFISEITDEDADGTPEVIDITWEGDIVVPSVVSVIGCDIGLGVEWVRRYPQTKEGFAIQVVDSPTQER